MINSLKNFNDNYANAMQALVPIVLAIISFAYYKIYKERQIEKGDAAIMITPIFWSFGKKYKVLSVHQYEKSDDISGYKQLKQNSRSDQWKELIDVKSSFFNLKYEVIPKNKKDILTVVISRIGKEKWKTISFNK